MTPALILACVIGYFVVGVLFFKWIVSIEGSQYVTSDDNGLVIFALVCWPLIGVWYGIDLLRRFIFEDK